METGLSEEHMAAISACVPALREHGVAITTHMYDMMFSEYPEVKKIFNMANKERGLQPRTLANSVLAFAENIRNLEKLAADVERIAHKHCSLNILPEQYPIVGGCLLRAIKDILGDAATEEVIAAWAAGYGLLAKILIAREKVLYEETKEKKGGWTGFREFEIIRKEQESEIITSFYLEPCDNGQIPTYLPGQYIALKIEVPGHGIQIRNYSLSCMPTDTHMRISVKRQEATKGTEQEGLVSNHLHNSMSVGDLLHVTPPFGDFFLELPKREDKPIVLLSAGVGITPLASMFSHLLREKTPNPIYFIHGTRNSASHALKSMIEDAKALPNINTHICYSRPLLIDVKGTDYTSLGHVDLALTRKILPSNDCEFYICGPNTFVGSLVKGFKEWKVASEHIHFECFGPFEPAAKPVKSVKTLGCPFAHEASGNAA